MIVNWKPLTPTSFDAQFNGFDLVLDKEFDGDWRVYIFINGKLRRSNVGGSSSSDVKAKVETICQRIVLKLAASAPVAQPRPTVVRSNKKEDVKKAPRQRNSQPKSKFQNIRPTTQMVQ